MLAPQLLQAHVQLLLEIVYLIGLFPGEVHHPLVLLFQQELKDIDEGDGVVVRVLEDGPVLLHAQTVGLVEKPGELNVHPGQLGELAGVHFIGEHPPVLYLNVGKAGGLGHLGQLSYPLQNVLLFVIVSPGHQHSDGIFLTKGVSHLLVGDAPVGLVVKVGVVGVKDIITMGGEDCSGHYYHKKDGRQNIAQTDDGLAPEVDLGHQIAVTGAVNGAAEQHEQPGHEQKHAQHGAHDALGQDDTHVETDAQLHQHQGDQTGDGGQAGGRDLHNGLAQGGDVRLPGVKAVVPLLHVPVAEDDGIVDGQRQLENDRDGFGNKGDGAEDKVGTHVQHRRCYKDDEVDGHLHVALGGKQQHHNDDHRCNGQDDGHFFLQTGRHVPANLGRGVDVIALQGGEHLIHGLHGGRVGLLSVKGDGEQGGGVFVVFLGAVKGHLRYALNVLQLVG